MDTETKLVSVERFPLKSLRVLRQHLRDQGIPVSDATAVRAAAIERANQIVIAAHPLKHAVRPDSLNLAAPAPEGGGA